MARLSETYHARAHANHVPAPSQRRSDFVHRPSCRRCKAPHGAHIFRGWCLAFAGLVLSSSAGTTRQQSKICLPSLGVAQPAHRVQTETPGLVFSVGVPAGAVFDRGFPSLRLRGGSEHDTPSKNRRTKLVKKRKDKSSMTDLEIDQQKAVIDPVASPFFPGDDEDYRIHQAYAENRPRNPPISLDRRPLRVCYDSDEESDPDEKKVAHLILETPVPGERLAAGGCEPWTGPLPGW